MSADKLYRKIDHSRLNGMEIRRHHPKRCKGLNDRVRRWNADLANNQANPAKEPDELTVEYDAPNHQKRMDFLLRFGRDGSRCPRQQLSPLSIVETIPWKTIREITTDPQEATLLHMFNTIVIAKNN